MTGLTPALGFLIATILENYELIEQSTAFVGSCNEIITFVGSFVAMLVILLLTGILNKKEVVIPVQS